MRRAGRSYPWRKYVYITGAGPGRTAGRGDGALRDETGRFPYHNEAGLSGSGDWNTFLIIFQPNEIIMLIQRAPGSAANAM